MSKTKVKRNRKAVAFSTKYVPGFLKRLDQRMKSTRLLNERYMRLCDEQGGEDAMSYQRRSLTENAIHVEALLFELRRQHIDGKNKDLSGYITAINALIGLYRTIGVERKAKQLPRALEYAATVAAQEQP